MSALPIEITVLACRSCDAGVLHCHGTVIVHVEGNAECVDHLDCELPAHAHSYVLVCAELDGGCC